MNDAMDDKQEQNDVSAGWVANRYHVETQAISDDEARRLLEEDTRQTKARLGAAERRGKRILITVVVVGVVLCLAGVGFVMVMGGARR